MTSSANVSTDMKQRYLWFDTDSGTDDMTSLLLLTSAINRPSYYQNSRWSMIGMSTVFGNVSLEQATNNLLLCSDALGIDTAVPVYEGCARSLMYNQPIETWEGHGHNGIGGAAFPKAVADVNHRLRQEHAALALIDAVKKHPKAIDVIAIGPLTNIALAITLCPALPTLMRSLCVMGGTVYGKGNITMAAEFNFYKDPEAAHIVLEAYNRPDGEPMLLMPIECTEECSFSWKEFASLVRFDTVAARFLQAIYEANQKFSAKFLPTYVDTGSSSERALSKVEVGFHSHDEDAENLSHPHSANHRMQPCDAYAIACLLEPAIITSAATLFGTIGLSGEESRGSCAWDWHYHHSLRRDAKNNSTDNGGGAAQTNSHGTATQPKNYVNARVVRRVDRARMLQMLELACSEQ